MTSSSDRAARTPAPRATSNRRSTLKAPWRPTPTRRRSIVSHYRRWTAHRRAAFRHQNGCGSDLLSVNLTTPHVFGCIFRSLWSYIVNVAKSSSKRLKTIQGKINCADLSERSKDFQNVFLVDVPSKSANVYSGGFRCNRAFLPPSFRRPRARSTTAPIFSRASFRRGCLSLFVFLVIVAFCTATFRTLL